MMRKLNVTGTLDLAKPVRLMSKHELKLALFALVYGRHFGHADDLYTVTRAAPLPSADGYKVLAGLEDYT